MGIPAMIVCCLVPLLAAPLAADDTLVSKGFNHFYNLEFDQAIAEFHAAADREPDDPNRWNHLAQATLYRAMYRSGELESQLVSGSNPFLRREKVNLTPDEDKTFHEAIDRALAISRSRLRQNYNDARALYSLGIAYGLRANYNFSVRKAWLDALRDASDARKAHLRACRLEPGNIDARLIPALFDYVTGSLPIGYRILSFLGGYRGDRERGIRELETVAREGESNRVDAQVLLAAVYRRERRAQEAIPLLQNLIREFPRSYLLSFEIVQMYGDLGDKPAALEQLQKIRRLQRQGAPGFAQLESEKIDRLESKLFPIPNTSSAAGSYKHQEAN